MPLPYPDEDMFERQISIATLVKLAEAMLSKDDPNIKDFVKLVLAGRNKTNQGQWERIFINGQQETTALEHGPVANYKLARDYDSAIGITHNLPFSEPLAIYPLSPFKETLKKTNHIRGKAFDENVCENNC